MTKKITLIMLVLLIVSALVFVSCNQDAGGASGGGGGEKPRINPMVVPRTEKEPIVLEPGTEGSNIVFNGDFESGDVSDVVDDGATVEFENLGDAHGTVMKVTQTEDYGEVLVDFTEYYGRGKSYYVEASFKNVGGAGTRTDDLTAYLSFSVVAGAGYWKYERNYDIPGMYDGSWLSDDEAEEIFNIATTSFESIDDGEWHTISAILDAQTIEDLLIAETDECGTPLDEPTMFLLQAVFFVGKYPEQDNYVYYLDNVVIKDLNTELPKEGITYKAPGYGDDEEEEEEEEY